MYYLILVATRKLTVTAHVWYKGCCACILVYLPVLALDGGSTLTDPSTSGKIAAMKKLICRSPCLL